MFSEFEIKRFRYAMARQAFMHVLHDNKENFIASMVCVETCTFLLGEKETPPFIDIFMEYDGLNWGKALSNPVCGPLLKKVLARIQESKKRLPADQQILDLYSKAFEDTNQPTFDEDTMNLLTSMTHLRRR
jgi:hypothetical protein